MVATIHTVTFTGLTAHGIEVQAQLQPGLPSFTIVGLADKAVSEARERVRGALHAMGLALPAKKITVNLAPADMIKEGSHFDLPIALAILAAMEVIPADALRDFVAMGELSLNGAIRRVAGVLPATLFAQQRGWGMVCPAECGTEAAWIQNVTIFAPDHLVAMVNHCKGQQPLNAPVAPAPEASAPQNLPDLFDVKGQDTAKRALEIAAAGGHNLLLSGPPGSGKSMLAARLPGLLPPLTPMEALEISMVQSLAGLLTDGRLTRHRPFRDPHHSASQPALVGGGHRAKPGEISLAHHGVLFLDELPEFDRSTLEALRQPLETGTAVIARANHRVTYPARFQLIAAMNPCRCGYLGDPARGCSRAPKCGADYQAKLSGPLLDRFDLFVDVPPVPIDALQRLPNGEPSAQVAARIATARHTALQRSEKHFGMGSINAHLHGKALEEVTQLDMEGKQMIQRAAENLNLSARGYHRVLRVARTIADLEQSAGIAPHHLAEALSFRQRLAA